MNKSYIRFLQKKILLIQEKIIFKTSHISVGGKITLFGCFICFFSLFIPWGGTFGNIMETVNIRNDSFNSFHVIMGYIGYFILSLLIGVSFIVASIKKKQKFKYFSLIEIRDHSCCIISSIIIFFLSLHAFFITLGLKTFSSNITHSNGIILCMTGAVIIFFGGIVIRGEYRINIKGSYINDSNKNHLNPELKEKKDNMKLPF